VLSLLPYFQKYMEWLWNNQNDFTAWLKGSHVTILLRHVCACLNLHQLWFKSTKVSYVEVVAIIKSACYYLSSQKMSDWFLVQWINIKFCVKVGRWWNMVVSVWSRKQMTKFAVETADIPMNFESLFVKITNEDNDHHFLQYQGYCSLWIHFTRLNSQQS
jgi:hypothetical protein